MELADWQGRLVELCERHDVPGAQVGVLADGDIRVAAAGITSRDTGVEVTQDTLFQYGSITKIWTTTLVMQLVDDGKITLDTPVVEVLPDFRVAEPGHADTVTVAHLLTHTSGVAGDLFTDVGDGDDCVERYVASLTTAPTVTPPGGRLSYCNAGFVVAGRIVEVLRDRAWDDAVAAHITEPLGLRHVITRAKDAPLFRTAVGHVTDLEDIDGPAVPTRQWMLPRAMGPAGLITGSAADLLRFTETHLGDGIGVTGERILSTDSARAMRDVVVDLSSVSTVYRGWGLGWRVMDWTRDGRPVTAVEHGGQTIGQNAQLYAFPDLGVAFCVLTNANSGPGLIQEVRDLLGAELGLTAPDPAVTDDGDLTPALGTYESVMLRSTLSRDPDGQIYLETISKSPANQGAPVPRKPVRPTGGGRFTVEVHGMVVEYAHLVDDDAEYLFGNRLLKRVD
ncbi:serine hydrolase [Actinokineospora sp. UTMC 2448]|uniref:serine hydrolase domain-containing protein n=1 Tax=Actinokineospora sp. UTMC 2448 TaxID=2268449 RepID=UPI0021648FAA|nr:serine hydrolase domain-containing protein [Actinokineospora sp. UTMC 2448]UVS79656.1 D-alanyl-D-alanine carboxypeptidase precursor [Actinokineospora sp. UTMC 2448]